ncbi:UNVERIFIED_CONTAM: hypothetical protein Sradi_6825700 [Sesamum radiatum]|uniref:Uncharacterized protein n=1 Tax=Sesamum radiatum TaxID=300843 RepID=A0AAW2JT05_SESRA
MDSDLSQLGYSLSLTEEKDSGLVFPASLWHAESISCSFFVAFDKYLIVLAPVETEDDPNLIDLNWCEFHVHIHSLPLEKMTQDIAAFIGNRLGKFEEVDLDRIGEVWGSSVCIWVALDILKPLKRALKVHTVLGDDHLISFTYERLQIFLLVWLLGHFSRQYELQFHEGFCDPGVNMPYGNWLRAATNSNSRGRSGGFQARTTVNVPLHAVFVSRSSFQSQVPTRCLVEVLLFLVSLAVLSQISPSSPVTHPSLSLPTECSGDEMENQGPSKVCKSVSRLSDVTNLEVVTVGLSHRYYESVSMELPGPRGPLDSSTSRTVNPVQLEEGQGWWRFTGIYGEPDNSKHELTWNLLARLRAQSDRSCLFAGDFNEILDPTEKSWGPSRPNWVLCSGIPVDGGSKPPGCSLISASELWLRARGLVWGVVGKPVLQKQGVLLEKQIMPEVATEICLVRKLLENVATYEEIVWRQRSKELWLREGDRNTGYFHRWASHRFKTNCIRKYKRWRDNGWCRKKGSRSALSLIFGKCMRLVGL